MKTIGRTNSGMIVEMSQQEYQQFLVLENTLSGRNLFFPDPFVDLDGLDLSKVMSALVGLCRTRQNINSLKNSILEIDKALGTVLESKDA